MKKILMCFVLTLFAFCGTFVLSACGDKSKDLNITFDYGYDSTTNQITIKEGNKVSVPKTPVRDGYEFAGWYENEKLEKEFDFSKPIDDNITIYADWVSNEIQDLFSWVEVDGGIKLSSVVGGDATMIPQDLIIPRVIDGQKVVELDNRLLQGHCYPEPYFELTTVKIPYGITKIGDYCFKDCYNIESILIPETVTSLGVGVFKLTSSDMSLKSAVLPSSLTTIPNEMFYNCAELESVNIPSGVTSIGNSAFYGCYELANVDLPSGLLSIGSGSFSICKKLEIINLPNGLQTIGDMAFQNCPVLSNVELPNTLQTIGNSAFNTCYKNNLQTIPSSVSSIGDTAFGNNLGIRYLEIPTTVTTLGRNVFNRCSGAIITTTLTENAEGWNSAWNTGVTTIYDSENNNLSSGNTYFIQNDCKYLIKTDSNDSHKYLSLEFCFKTDEKLVLDTKVTFEGTEYPVEEMANTAFNRSIHANVKKLIFNEGIVNSKFTFGNYVLNYMPDLEYIILPSTTQSLAQTITYKMCQNGIIIYTNLTEEDVATWTYKANGDTFYYPELYTIGEWEYVNGEPQHIIAKTVTETEWNTALVLNTNNLTYTMTATGTNVVWKYDGTNLYTKQIIVGQDDKERYFVKDGSDYFKYEKIGTANWSKTSMSENDFNIEMSTAKPNMSEMFLFSEFTYNATTERYEATSCQANPYITNISISFEDGILTGMTYDMDSQTMNLIFDYNEVTIEIPQI